MSDVRKLREVAEDETLSFREKALECVVSESRLHPNDTAREEFQSAAQVFSTLAVADAIAQFSYETQHNIAGAAAHMGPI